MAIPYARHLGLEAAMEDGSLIASLSFREGLIGNTALPATQLCVVRETTRPPPTIGVTVEYLRPARARATFARAKIKRLRRRIANVHVEAWQDGRGPDRPPAGALHDGAGRLG